MAGESFRKSNCFLKSLRGNTPFIGWYTHFDCHTSTDHRINSVSSISLAYHVKTKFNEKILKRKIGLSVSYQMVVYHSNFGIQWGVSTQTKDS